MFSACVAVAVMSCNDNSTTDTTKTDSSSVYSTPADSAKMTTPTDNTYVATVEAPAAARTSFETKYKNAKNVTWKMYSPPSTTMDDWDYYYDLDTSYYQVNYNWNDLDYMAWYNPKGEWIKTYVRMENNSSLPAAVNNAINKKFSGYKIIDVELEDRKKGMQYEVDLDNGTLKKKVVFSPSGAILKQKDKT
jgi:uncharacterized membrane protein YkoI